MSRSEPEASLRSPVRVNEEFYDSDYGSGSDQHPGKVMSKLTRSAPTKGAKSAKEPTPFSKAFPPKAGPLPDEFKEVLTWRPTQMLKKQSAKSKK